LARLLIFITLGLVVGQTIEATGWTRRLAVVAALRCSDSPIWAIAAVLRFTTAFFSGVAANAMLLEFFKEKKITRRQLFLGNLMNQLPAYFLHLPTTFFIVIPLTGKAGALYFLLTFVALVIRTILVSAYGRLFAGWNGFPRRSTGCITDRRNSARKKSVSPDYKKAAARAADPNCRICGPHLYLGFHGQRHGRV
jgi:hypothetical protein